MIAARRLVHADCRGQCMRFSSTIAESLYEALGVRKTASSEEIKAAFRKVFGVSRVSKGIACILACGGCLQREPCACPLG